MMNDGRVPELLQWHDAGREKPDADTTVMMWLQFPTGGSDWEGGWWDGEAWRCCESGGVCAWPVSHWAEPEGPAC